MLCLSYVYKLQRLDTVGDGMQPMCSALRTINPVCSVSVVLFFTEVTHVELYFHLKFSFVKVNYEEVPEIHLVLQ